MWSAIKSTYKPCSWPGTGCSFLEGKYKCSANRNKVIKSKPPGCDPSLVPTEAALAHWTIVKGEEIASLIFIRGT